MPGLGGFRCRWATATTSFCAVIDAGSLVALVSLVLWYMAAVERAPMRRLPAYLARLTDRRARHPAGVGPAAAGTSGCRAGGAGRGDSDPDSSVVPCVGDAFVNGRGRGHARDCENAKVSYPAGGRPHTFGPVRTPGIEEGLPSERNPGAYCLCWRWSERYWPCRAARALVRRDPAPWFASTGATAGQ